MNVLMNSQKMRAVGLLGLIMLLFTGAVSAVEIVIRGDVVSTPILGVISDVDITGLKPEPAKSSNRLEEAAEQSKSDEKFTLEQLEAIAKLPPRKNKAGMRVHSAMLPLFKDMILHYTGGNYKNKPLHFRLHMPEPFEEGKKYPMVVWLHGAGECGSNNINQLWHLHHIIPSLVGPKKRDFFLLVSQCPKSHVSWEAHRFRHATIRIRSDGTIESRQTNDPIAQGNAPIGFTLAMTEAVMEKYPVDPNRVTVAGLSTGGEGTWKILERRPNLFAAAVPIVSWATMNDESLRKHPILKKIPIWAVYSSDDRGIDRARKEFERLREAGCRVSKTEFGVCGHRAWTPAMLQGDIFGWLISRAKDGDRYYAAEPSPTDPEKVGIFADITEGDQFERRKRKKKQKPTLAPKKKVSTSPTKKKTRTPTLVVDPFPAADPFSTTTVKKAKVQTVQPRKTKEEAAIVRKLMKRFNKSQMKPAGKATIGKFYITGGMNDGQIECNRIFVSNPHQGYVISKCQVPFDEIRERLILKYLKVNEVKKALAVADKVKDRKELIKFLLKLERPNVKVLDYIDRELDRMEKRNQMPMHSVVHPSILRSSTLVLPHPMITKKESKKAKKVVKAKDLQPIPAGKKSPMEECGKEWTMSTTTQYGMFPSGWEREAAYIPDYVVNETGWQLYVRLSKAFNHNDLKTMKEICNSFIKLDDLPLGSPWFDTSGGRLKGRIKYTLNKKAKLVVKGLREIAKVKAESKKAYVELAKKALAQIDKILNPEAEKSKGEESK